MANLVVFPYLHKEYLPDTLFTVAKVLNVGFASKDDPNYFTPSNLVLSAKEAQSYLDFCLEFGAQFKNVKDMHSYLWQEQKDVERPSQLKAELWQRIFKRSPKQDKRDQALEHQLVLILSYSYEQKIKEVIQLEQEISQKVKEMQDILGIEEQIFKRDLFFTSFFSSYDLKVEKILPAFDYFLPLDWQLLIITENVFNELTELGIKWGKKQPGDKLGLDGNVVLGEAMLSAGNRKFVYWPLN